jgi:GWxTD domain-containing protein
MPMPPKFNTQMRIFFRLIAILVFVGVGRLQALDASVSHHLYYSPGQPYVEVGFFFWGKSLTRLPQPDSTFVSAVEVVITFSDGDRIVQYDKFTLNSPRSRSALNFRDLKRYALPNGNYVMEILMTDANQAEDKLLYKSALQVAFVTDRLQQSDICLLASIEKAVTEGPFTKNGLDLDLLPYNFYGRNANSLAIYHEVYQADKIIAEPFAVSFVIERLNGAQKEVVSTMHKRQEPAAVVPIVQLMDISDLPSGNYSLTIEVKDRNRQLLSSKKIDFQRSNPQFDLQALYKQVNDEQMGASFVSNMDAAELKYSLLAIQPLLPQRDVEVVNLMLRYDSLRAQKIYLLSFWAKENAVNPKDAYDKYMEVARAVDQQFDSGFRFGFETDRGYVYLKYGRPNDIVRQENEPSAPPYEIWSYDEVKQTNQNNVRFVFYNPSLAADDYILLHSDVIGERNNPQWQLQLYRSAPGEHPQDFIQGTDVMDNMGRRARQNFLDW